tara:strand:+ start:239 stop:1036 length:798 start_codon:yes stop_codon:yes gene_type:complete
MIEKFSIFIFTDLDASLIQRDTFKFDEIKDYIKSLISKGIYIIPNTSKTEIEINEFNKELGLNLPYISENGSSINGLNLINKNFPNQINLSRDKDDIFKIFKKIVPENLKVKCRLIFKMEKKVQSEIFGLSGKKLKDALNRNYSIPFIFSGNLDQRRQLNEIVNKGGLTLHEGGRVINICDNVSKVKSMNKIIKMVKKTEDNVKIIGVGDNYNDLDMLKNSDIACLVFNDQFTMEPININNCIVSKNPAPIGWQEVVKMALDKLK